MKEEENPFLIHSYLGPEWFCDRKNETKTMAEAMLNGRNITLCSIRRMGKTGLLFHVGHYLEHKTKVKFMYSDIFSTYSNEDLAKQLGDMVWKTFAPKTGFTKWISLVFKSIVPKFAVDPVTGSPELSFDFNSPEESTKTIENIFLYLKTVKHKIVWALDEFQQIAMYEKPGTEALLRGLIQQTPNVNFIFSGSHKTMLLNMFNHNKRPFYQSTQWMEIEAISEKEYTAFIKRLFNNKSNRISDLHIKEITDYTLCHTWYTQYFCNRLYSAEKKITDVSLLEMKHKMMQEFEPVYHNFKALLSPFQWQVLRAIALDEKVYTPTSYKFLFKHKLGAAASVKRAIESLINQDMVSEIRENNTRYFRLNDVFLMRWFQTKR